MTTDVPTLPIGGEDYTLERLPPGADALAVRVANAGEPERSYRVSRDRGGFWRCSCPSWRYTRPPAGRPRECKHTRAVRRLLRLALEVT